MNLFSIVIKERVLANSQIISYLGPFTSAFCLAFAIAWTVVFITYEVNRSRTHTIEITNQS